MKKLLLLLSALLFFCFNSMNLKSQILVDSNKLWYVDYWDTFTNDFTYMYKFKGDTTFGSYQYMKLYSIEDTLMTGWSYINAMREDANKVYSYSSPSDILYYDFNLNVNDTFFSQGHKMVVNTVDTVTLLDNEKRKRISLSDGTCSDKWIAGIGSLYGLTNVGYIGYNGGYEENLTCLFENDTLKYHDMAYPTCYYVTIGINEISKKEIINMFPNPATDNITIDVSAALNIPTTIEISNIQGQLLEQQTTNLKTTNIVVSSLAKGMYFIKVKTERGMAVKKFIKE